MAKPGPATQAKRQRERDKQERREIKIAERAQRRLQKESGSDRDLPEGQDPDLVGIFPGPHNMYQGEAEV
jgi:hypothetical protein